jgi:diguanylate cyclase (GGDEF)-like protein
MTDQAAKSHVIVADDEGTIRQLLRRQLEAAGYGVTLCGDGREALAALREHPAQIVIADWQMPEMNGVELCRAVRALCSDDVMPHVFFMLLTAQADMDSIIAGLEAGADDYLTKPYHKAELLARIRVGERLLDLQRALVERQRQIARSNRKMQVLNRKLRELATTDELTKLANRRHLFDRLEHIWALSVRHDRPLSCIMLDVDHFKRFNDTHGHAAGDDVLRTTASTILSLMRRSDVCGRFGGEEFVVVCPETPGSGAAAQAERIRAAIESTPVQIGSESIQVTVSIGVAEKSASHANAETMISEADELLYRAKAEGRNRVCWKSVAVS